MVGQHDGERLRRAQTQSEQERGQHQHRRSGEKRKKRIRGGRDEKRSGQHARLGETPGQVLHQQPNHERGGGIGAEHQTDPRRRKPDRLAVYRHVEGKQLDARERHSAHDQRAPQGSFLEQVERPPRLLVIVMLAARRHQARKSEREQHDDERYQGEHDVNPASDGPMNVATDWPSEKLLKFLARSAGSPIDPTALWIET